MQRKESMERVNGTSFEFDMNPYESFMRKHLQHYGYYTGRNSTYKEAFSAFADWDKTLGLSASDSDDDEDEDDTQDNKTQEELLRTTQLVYSYQAGKMVPKLREPRQLFGFNPETGSFTQGARWPSEIQVLNERVTHIPDRPAFPEPFYVRTGLEKTPMSRSHEGQGRIVYEYEPVVGSFFLRSRVGGCRTGCTRAAVELESEKDKTLIFESRFESGNLCKAVQVGEFEYELWLRNDLYTNKHLQWFYFRVSNTRANTNYRFTIVNLMKPDSLYNNGMRPLFYSEKDAKDKKQGWLRAGNDIKYYKNNIRYSAGKQDRTYYSLTWTCQFTHDRDAVYFSHCYPYTYTDLQDYLNDIAVDPIQSKLCKQRVMCRTLAGNLVYILTITSPTKTPEEMKHRKAVVLTSRVHPGESNASWMMKGFMDYLLGNTADAKLLRDTFVFKIIPMLNPDGVIVGNYRCSLAGRDLNRNYKTVLKDSFPSVWHTKTMIRKLQEEREVLMYCDLHGHSRRQNVFIYGCENRGNPQKRLRERIFPVMLGKNAPDKFLYEYCKFKVQKSKEGTGRIVMWNMGIMNSFTLEATFAGSVAGKKKGYHFSMTDLEEMGYNFCDTLLDYCDPDNSKVNKILVEIEHQVRQDILQHLRQHEGQDLPDVMDISLDEAISTDLESSDGGSDSSVSDGLPAHLQYIAQKNFPKKKRLRTRKERDRHKCNSGKQDSKKVPPPSEAEKKESAKSTRSKLNITKRPKSLDDPRSEKVRMMSSKDTQTNKPILKEQSDGYLEALTNAYLRKGSLQTDQTREIPHFRYTAGGNGSNNTSNVTQTFEGVCQHHDQAFAAQYVANHLQQFKYPVVLQKNNCKCVCESGHCQAYDLSELSRYKYNIRSQSSMLDRKHSARHIVEVSASQNRQQEFLQGENIKDDDHDEINSPIKQHPPPFDEALDRQHAYEVIKQVGLDCRQNALINLRTRSARSSQAESQTDMSYVSKHSSMVPRSTSEHAYVKPKEKITSMMSTSSELSHRPFSSTRFHQRPPPLNLRNRRLIKSETPPNDCRPASPSQSASSSGSDQKLQDEITSTMQSITEIKESLLNPKQRANLSPTTGHFVEHFVKKTEAEVNDIAAQLHLQKLHTSQHESSTHHTNRKHVGIEHERNAMPTNNQTSSSEDANNTQSNVIPNHATKQVAMESVTKMNVVTNHSGNKVHGEYYDLPSKTNHKQQHNANSRSIVSRNPTTTTERLLTTDMGRLSLENITQQGQHSASHVRRQEIIDGSTKALDHYHINSNCNAKSQTLDSSVAAADKGINQGTPSSQRMSSGPTKISLMISRGSTVENTSTGNQFHAYPLTRQQKTPLTLPKRR